MISQWLVSYWFWFIIALCFLILEIFVTGFFLIWFGIGAALAGLVELLFPGLHSYFSLLVFSVSSVSSLLVWKFIDNRWPRQTDRPMLNQRGQTYIGRIVRLSDPIQAGQGRMRLDDSEWPVRGPDLPGGALVKIVSVDSCVMNVVPLQATKNTPDLVL